MQHHVSPRQAETRVNGGQPWLKRHGLRRLLCVLTALWFALLCCSAPNRASADLPPGDLVYLYTSNGPVNVTSTYYNSNGHDYVVYGSTIEVVFDFTHGHIYDVFNNLIGYILE